ncbi:hypothetical protein AAF712_016320 [Marasmius tenuissimus]|uniref:Integrase core domain-containing protein n=1 Tax=Marasmius tenuissimus TaxID=585030 RepID=A0ABR2Z7Z6_9AGAR
MTANMVRLHVTFTLPLDTDFFTFFTGLIRWRVIIHAFVDGYLRMIMGIQVNDNNRADTVLQLFMDAIQEHGTPSRVCGDHGVENSSGVARYMEENFGVERASYIWGRSVHNIRIERLWRDVTQGFGLKWYNFFYDLELSHGLLPDVDTHIWLLHTLFLPSIDQDAHEWAGAWNSHRLRLDDSRSRSPRDFYFFGAVEDGIQGPEGVMDPSGVFRRLEEDIGDPEGYGVDWVDLGNADILRHHNNHNPHQIEHLDSRQPPHLSLVDIPVFDSLFTSEEQVDIFEEVIARLPEYYSRDMEDCQSPWSQALHIVALLIQPESS